MLDTRRGVHWSNTFYILAIAWPGIELLTSTPHTDRTPQEEIERKTVQIQTTKLEIKETKQCGNNKSQNNS